nr:nuclear transcription factor Y subunit B-10-like isoform X1 [Ipomoea batatas]GMC90516.1 nuclear transcription factor Y subunit B-10-like isoform X1 [Ipomoea batatas]
MLRMLRRLFRNASPSSSASSPATSDKCQREKRKTINGDDLLWAMATLGFEDYLDPLKVYLTRYREGDTKGSAKAADGPGKRDGMQPTPNMQLAHQGSFTQGMSYGNSQVFSLYVPD